MTPVGGASDPRSIITPDAFQVSTELLGLELASARRRLAAILLDLVVIAILPAVTRSFALVLGIVAAVLLIRAGFKRSTSRGIALSVGCLGMFIGIVTTIVWLSVGPSGGGSDDDDDEVPFVAAGITGPGSEPPGPAGRVFDALASAAVRAAYEDAESLEEAERATRELIRASEEVGMQPGEVRAALLEGVPPAAEWAEDAPAMIDRLLPSPSEPIEPRDVIAIRDEVSLYTTAEALEAYAALLRSGRAEDMDLARRAALEARLTTEIAADTLLALQATVAELAEDLRETEDELDEAEDELEEVQSRGLFSNVR